MHDDRSAFQEGYAQGVDDACCTLKQAHTLALADIGSLIGGLVERLNVMTHRLQEAEAVIAKLEAQVDAHLEQVETLREELQAYEDEEGAEILEAQRPRYEHLLNQPIPVLPTARGRR